VLLSAPVLADPSLGNWSPTAGAYTINTTTLQLSGPGTSFTGLDDSGVATFSFGTVDIPAGVTITVSGSRPVDIVANTSFTSAGSITGEGGSSTDETAPVGGSPGGPGGGAGGPGGLNAGSGPGAGGAASNNEDGAGGGGFGGVGAAGGVFGGGTAGVGGSSYGNLLSALQGGSGGGGASTGGAVNGGGGGGAIEIVSPTGSITLATGAVINVNGGGGATGGNGASGGGSGGAILLEAYSITNNGALSADGGEGGGGGCCGGGGAGGGGRIAEVYNNLGGSATNNVTGGTSYVRSTSGCCASSPHSTQPDPTGALGSIVLISPPTTTTATATLPSPAIAATETLNATVSTVTIPAPPTGSVVFSDTGGTLCTGVLTVGASSSAGSCTYKVSAGDSGAITATYDPSGPYAVSAAAITIGVPIPVTGANAGPLGIVSGAVALMAGLALLSLSAVRSRRRLVS
jgi:hypothetical protein